MARNSLKNVIKLVETAKEEIPVEQSFLNDLKRSIELTAEKSTRKPSQTYKPSSMNCIRNMYYQVVGAEQDNNEANYLMVGITNSGSDIHVRIQTAIANMKNNGIDCEYLNVGDFVRIRGLDVDDGGDLTIVDESGVETKLFHNRLNMSFLSDGIIRYKGKYYIVEFKTETVNKWYSRQGVDLSHYNQATAYSIAFGLNDVLFVYINRDMLDMKSYLFNVTDEMRSNLINKIETCNSYVSMGEVPPIPADVEKKTCNYCNYKTICRRN